MSSAKQRRRKQNRASPPRAIGANDNIQTANDNGAVVIRGVTLNKRQTREIAEAEAHLSSADLQTRKAGRDLMAKVDGEIDTELARRTREVGEAETIAMAEARGATVRIGKDTGTVTVTRDGLATLSAIRYDRETRLPIPPTIDETQLAAGLRYRADYERVDPGKGLTPPTAKGRGGGGEGFADKRAESWDRVRTIHLMIAGIERSQDSERRPNMPNLPDKHPAMQAIWVLQEVAGKGSNLRDLASSGSVRARLSKALVLALGCASICYGLE